MLVSMIHDLYTYCENDITSECRSGLKGIVEFLVEAMEEEVELKDSTFESLEKTRDLHPKLWLDIVQTLADQVFVCKTEMLTTKNTENQRDVESKKGSKDDSSSDDEEEFIVEEEGKSDATCDS